MNQQGSNIILLRSAAMSLNLALRSSTVPAAGETAERRRRDPIEVIRRSGPILVGLGAIGFTQPLLDLYGRNGEVLASSQLSPVELVAWLGVVAFGVPLALLAIELLVDAAAPAAWPLARRVTRLIVSASIVLVVLRFLGIDDLVAVGLVTAAGATAAVVALELLGAARTFAAFLGLANLAFVGLFLAADGGDLLGARSVPIVDLPEDDYPPIVVVIFDEFPVTLILDEDGTINEERFPEMAALADRATWFRNASGVSQFTTWAVPSLLTGRLTSDDQLPVVGDHPRSLYTLLADEYEVRSYSVAVDICPDDICPDDGNGGLWTAIKDAAVVWGHRGLPEPARQRLPRIDQRLGGFTGGEATATVVDEDAVRAQVWESIPLDEREPGGQGAIFLQLIDELEGGPNLLVAHLALPHWPWNLTPFGYEISTSHDHELRYVDEDVPGRDFIINQKFQRHALQAGAADALLGELVDTLEARGLWDETLLVVTSDHGNSHLGPHIGRHVKADRTNVEELLRVPLFIKAPGQRLGERRDENARTTDIVPSIVDLLDIDTDWSFDGHSLFDGSPFPEENAVVNADVDTMSTDVAELLDLVRRHAEWYTGDSSWDGLAAVGPLGPLVGRSEAELRIATMEGDLAWDLDQEAELADLDLGSGRAPLVVTGTLWTDPGTDPPEYGLVAVNGTIAGVAGGFVATGVDDRAGFHFSALLADRLVDGVNRVELYLPARDAADPSDLDGLGFVRVARRGG
jgi:hypothetical protein